jgi:RNA polymerase sigma-70 factor (ECF subfamily)
LALEAVALGRLLIQLMPQEPEAHGLLALMLHCQARRKARYASDGEFVPLDQQDATKWSRALIDEAEEHLRLAAGFRCPGRFQLEAAIQSVHGNRAKTGHTEWQEIALLYEGLVRVSPGIGSLVGRAVALAQAGNPTAGLVALDAIPSHSIVNYQPYWAARGHLLHLLKRDDEARDSWNRAAGLTDEPALRKYLAHRSADVSPG